MIILSSKSLMGIGNMTIKICIVLILINLKVLVNINLNKKIIV